jgi:hypothetical protein
MTGDDRESADPARRGLPRRPGAPFPGAVRTRGLRVANGAPGGPLRAGLDDRPPPHEPPRVDARPGPSGAPRP